MTTLKFSYVFWFDYKHKLASDALAKYELKQCLLQENIALLQKKESELNNISKELFIKSERALKKRVSREKIAEINSRIERKTKTIQVQEEFKNSKDIIRECEVLLNVRERENWLVAMKNSQSNVLSDYERNQEK